MGCGLFKVFVWLGILDPMSINKQSYFKHRNQTLSVRNDRQLLGDREVKTLQAMLQNLGKEDCINGRAIVDLGCGDQYIKKAIESRGATYRGIDIEECNLETQEFPIASDSQDIAVCLALIEHMHDPGHFLAETLRVLKTGGLLWLSTPDIEACGSKFWNDPTHVHPYTRASMRTLLRMNGFADVLVTPNYRCKPIGLYRDTGFNFFRARHLMPFLGISRFPVPDCLKGHCTGLFALAKKPKQVQ
jgi:2-polyprenyl-3-methyl-5-hydroxy-6-metoxy-1,4-benzoquinol methylase